MQNGTVNDINYIDNYEEWIITNLWNKYSVNHYAEIKPIHYFIENQARLNPNNIAIVHVIPTLVLLFPIKSSGAIFSNLYGLMFWSLFAFSYGFLLRAKNTHKNLF